ncbi:MAG: redox-sensing transcriptional repressor Rex [Verrucomicrobiota bacterium]
MAPRKNDRTESAARSIRPVIPPKTIYRMSIYMRCLQRLKQNQIQTVSSEALASAAGVKSTQLRKDLTYFGQFGTRGLGYDVGQLSTMIGDLLGTNRLQPVVLIGAGHLGTALLSYRGFEQEGFELIAAFDAEPHRERDRPLTTPVYGMERLPRVIRDHGVKMAVLTVPAAAAQAVANQLVDAGISGILNFSPSILSVPDTVMVKNVNLAIELEHLSYFVQQ